jgi:hypothetical protein
MDFTPPPSSDFHIDIGPAELDFYAVNGYLVCEQMTTPEELEWLVGVYDCLISQPRSGFLDTVFDVAKPYGSTAPPKLGQLLFPERLVPAIRDTAMWNNARRVATRLLSVPAEDVEHWGHILYKEGNGGNETPWHQDEAYWDVELHYHAVGAWMPLQDVDINNGCLWFLPGSHRGEVLSHRHLHDDPAVHILELTEPLDTSAAVPIPLAAGGMSFHHPRLLHHARENSSGTIRRAWANEFQTAPVQRDTPADHPWVTEGREALARTLAQRSGA